MNQMQLSDILYMLYSIKSQANIYELHKLNTNLNESPIDAGVDSRTIHIIISKYLIQLFTSSNRQESQSISGVLLSDCCSAIL